MINRDDFFIEIIINVIDVGQLVVDDVVDRIGNREDPVTGLVKRISINNDHLRTKRVDVQVIARNQNSNSIINLSMRQDQFAKLGLLLVCGIINDRMRDQILITGLFKGQIGSWVMIVRCRHLPLLWSIPKDVVHDPLNLNRTLNLCMTMLEVDDKALRNVIVIIKPDWLAARLIFDQIITLGCPSINHIDRRIVA